MTPKELLEQEGEINEILEGNLEPNHEGYQINLDINQECNLCKINKYPYQINEDIFFENNNFYIVETYDLKGHDVRNMVVSKEHGKVPVEKLRQKMKTELAEITSGHIQEGQMVIFGSMNTFPEHYHIIASDIDGDIEPIHDYELYTVEDSEYFLEERQIRSRLGKKLL